MTYEEKVQKSIEFLKFFNKPDDPYYLCYSGGKDSDVIRILADIAGVNYEIHNNHTTVDAPETVYYIREVFSEYGEMKFDKETRTRSYGDKAFIHYPEKNMFQLIVKKRFPPTRLARYCCQVLKENGGFGRRKVTGVRWAESLNRKNNHGLLTFMNKSKELRKKAADANVKYTETKKGGIILNMDNDEAKDLIETCYRTTSTLINPIIEWTDEDVWKFLNEHSCESNPLYQKGYRRVGCIGCPMSGARGMKKEFAEYPKYKDLYKQAFDKIADDFVNPSIKTGEDLMRWWLGDDPNQITIDDWLNAEETQ